jgi:hypothetical protein
MPYIKPEDRDYIDDLVDEIGGNLKIDGDLNYLLFALCKRWVKPSYNNYKNFIGELNECIAEIRRRQLAPYEEEAMKRNGDV